MVNWTAADVTQFNRLRKKYLAQALQKPRPRYPLPEEVRMARRHLARVIRKIQPGMKYVLPEEIFALIHLLTPQNAIDMVILDDKNRVLYVKRKDRWFSGFELVGGYGHMSDRTLAEWCNRLSMRDIGARVKLLGFVGIHRWRLGEHAHGTPNSMVAVCKLVTKPTKNLEKIVFRKTVPKNMVPNHGNFARVALRALKAGRVIPVI